MFIFALGILTNAHCVQDHILVQVRRCGDDTKYEARVVSIGEECDLALLTVDDNRFWEDDLRDTSNKSESIVNRFAVNFGKVPKLLDPVNVVGYPIGTYTHTFSRL